MSADDRFEDDDSPEGDDQFELDPRREAVAVHAACGRTTGQIAEILECTPRTVRRLRAEPEVAGRIDELRAELYADAAGRLAGLLRESTDRLEQLLRSDDQAVQLRAVQTVLKVAAEPMQRAAEPEDALPPHLDISREEMAAMTDEELESHIAELEELEERNNRRRRTRRR